MYSLGTHVWKSWKQEIRTRGSHCGLITKQERVVYSIEEVMSLKQLTNPLNLNDLRWSDVVQHHPCSLHVVIPAGDYVNWFKIWFCTFLLLTFPDFFFFSCRLHKIHFTKHRQKWSSKLDIVPCRFRMNCFARWRLWVICMHQRPVLQAYVMFPHLEHAGFYIQGTVFTDCESAWLPECLWAGVEVSGPCILPLLISYHEMKMGKRGNGLLRYFLLFFKHTRTVNEFILSGNLFIEMKYWGFSQMISVTV